MPKSKSECDCDHWPWPKRCDPICAAKLLGQVSVGKLTKVLDLPLPLSRKVHTFAHTVEPESLAQFRKKFTTVEVNRIAKSVRQLDVGKARQLGLEISPKFPGLKE
jgi:hypothetical protein